MWRVIPDVISDENANPYQITEDFYIYSAEIISLEMFVHLPSVLQMTHIILFMKWASYLVAKSCLTLLQPHGL